MPVPDWNGVGVLPPFVGDGTDPAGRAPWPCTPLEFAQRFCTSEHRQKLLIGFLTYRTALRKCGVFGVQWVDGSFVENCESRRKKPPGDIDVVTVFGAPPGVARSTPECDAFDAATLHLFRGPYMKPLFQCDAYALPLYAEPEDIARSAAYWVGLFSHAKTDTAHKGICEISLTSDETEDASALDHVTQWRPPDA